MEQLVVKAHYRYAKAAVALDKLDEASSCVCKALQFESADAAEFKLLIQAIKARQSAIDARAADALSLKQKYDALEKALASRHIKFTVPLNFSLDRALHQNIIAVKFPLPSGFTFEPQCHDGMLSFPVIIIYPEPA